MKRNEPLESVPIRIALALVVLGLGAARPALPQGPPFAGGLHMPAKTAFTPHRNLVVAEGGTAADNSGRISLVDRVSATRRSLVEGLPSGISRAEEPGSPSGPAGVAVLNRTVYVVIGAGDGVLPGPAPGTEQANPTPASPILSSLLSLESSVPLDVASGGFVLTPADHAALKAGITVRRQNEAGEELVVKLVADFPDFTSEPRGDFPANVRASNPFGVAVQGQAIYVVDASQNAVIRVDAASGAATTMAKIGSLPNPLPMGPPFIDPVPDSIAVRGGDLVLTTLTGFPFPAGSAAVLKVATGSGTVESLVGGLTTAIDVVPLGDGPADPLLVLEFSTNMLQQAPGRLRMVSPGGESTTIVEGLPTPSGMAVDRVTGEIFVSHIFPGFITRIDAAALLPATAPSAIVPVVSDAAGAFGTRFTTRMQFSNPNPFAVAGRLRVHRAGGEGPGPSTSYALGPFETRPVEVPESNGSGSVDLLAEVGPAPLTVTTITETVSGNRLQIPLLAPSDAVAAGMRAALVTPADASNERFNVGIRTLGQGAGFTVRVRASDGVVLTSNSLAFAPDYFGQFSFESLLGQAVGSNQSIEIEVTSGSAIFYGAAVENATGAMSLQIAKPLGE